MFFLTFSILDYLFQGVVAVLDFFHILKGTESFLKVVDLPEEKRYLELVVVGINAGFLIMIFPVWGVQIVNMVKSPKKERNVRTERTESRGLDKEALGSLGSLGSFSELSDTASMLLMTTEDWNPSAVQNQVSFLAPKNMESEEKCCWSYEKSET